MWYPYYYLISGTKDIENLYWLLYNNKDWLHRQLDIKHTLPLATVTPNTDRFSLDMAPKSPVMFNPLEAHQQIGPYKFDHVSTHTKTLPQVLATNRKQLALYYGVIFQCLGTTLH